jgi:tetratricopeptide (TPR) repeat protein
MQSELQTLLDQAEVFESQNRPDLEIPILRKAIAVSPDSALAFARLTVCLRRNDQFLEAVTCGQETVRLRPNSSYAHTILATVFVAIDRYPDAIVHATKAIGLSPSLSWVYWPLANSYVELRQYADAIEVCRRGLSVNAAEMTLRHHLAWALAGKGEAEEATATIAAFFADRPNSETSHGVAGWSNWLLRRLDVAATHFEEALRFGPTSYWLKEGLGTVRYDQGRWREAEELLSEAYRINPFLRRARLLLDSIRQRQGDYPDGKYPTGDSTEL